MADKLWRSTIVIWTDFDPSSLELEDLAREASTGSGICTDMDSEIVDANECPRLDYFGLDEDDDAQTTPDAERIGLLTAQLKSIMADQAAAPPGRNGLMPLPKTRTSSATKKLSSSRRCWRRKQR